MPKKKRSVNWYFIKKKGIAAVFLLPGVLATLLFKYYTIIDAIRLSFYRYDIRKPPGQFIGLQNFEALFRDSNYWRAWKNTFVFLALVLLITFLIPLLQALFLEPIARFQNLASTLYILPALIPGTITIVLWKWIWNPSYGAANYLLKLAGVSAQSWMSDTRLVKFCIVFPGIIGGGLGVLIYLSAIYGISEDVKEAARLDGCIGFKRIFYITLPNIKFLIFINFVMSIIGSMQMLDNIYQYTNGGPALASESSALYVFHQYMDKYNYGQGSAASLILMAVIAILTMLQLRLNEKQEGE